VKREKAINDLLVVVGCARTIKRLHLLNQRPPCLGERRNLIGAPLKSISCSANWKFELLR
jgi:hypothetical protein